MRKYALVSLAGVTLLAGHSVAQTVSTPLPQQPPSPAAEFASQLARLNVNVMEANTNLQNQLTAANAETADVKKQLAAANTENDNLKKQATENSTQISDLQKKLVASNVQVGDLQKQLDEATAKLTGLAQQKQ